MAHFNGDQYDNFAFDPGTVGEDWLAGSRPAYDIRPMAARLSRWNVDYNGPRVSVDYTRTSLGFAFKDTMENPEVVPGIGYGTDFGYYNYNPMISGVAIAHLRMLNDSMFVMGMYHGGLNLSGYNDDGTSINQPRYDVMDRKETDAVATASGTATKNYPSEGWYSFGKKYDKERVWAGNTWINGMA